MCNWSDWSVSVLRLSACSSSRLWYGECVMCFSAWRPREAAINHVRPAFFFSESQSELWPCSSSGSFPGFKALCAFYCNTLFFSTWARREIFYCDRETLKKLSSCWNNSAGSSVTTATINLTSSSCIFYISVHLFAFQRGGVSSRSLWEAAAVQPEEVQFLPLRAGSVRPPGSARRDRTHRLRRFCGKGEGETQRDAGRSWDIKQTHRTVCKDRNQRRYHSYDGEQRWNLNFRDSVASRQEGDPLPGAVTLRLPFRLNSSTVTQ